MENVENEENVNQADQNQMVNRLLTLMSQRDKLDKEISILRAEINSSIAASRQQHTAATPPPFKPVASEPESQPATPPPFEVAPPPIPPTMPAPQSAKAAPVDSERNIGVKWMAIVGITIAVLGLSLCIKILLDRDLIGSVGRVVLGYVASAAMVAGAFKVPATRKVLKDTLLFGGANLGFAITWIAYSYFDLFSSPVTLAVMWTITSAMLAYSYFKDNKLLFSYALFWFVMSPFCAGYSFDSHTNRTVFWMVFTIVVNVGLCFVYKVKKWSSVYASAFMVTALVCLIKFFDGADLSHWINVLYFAILCAVFYAGAVVLQKVKPNFDYTFLFLTAVNLTAFAICSAIELHNRHSVSHTYLYMSVALCVTAFLFQKLQPEIKVLFTSPFTYALVFANVALLVNFFIEYSEWFPLVFAVEILAAALVYWFSKVDYFKRVTLSLVYLSYAVVFMGLPILDYNYSIPHNYWVVLNVGFISKLVYIAVLVLILSKITDKVHKILFSLIVYAAVALSVAHEISIYWDYVDSYHSDSQEDNLERIMLVLWYGVLAVATSLLPKKWEFLSYCKIAGSALLLLNLLMFCAMAVPSLADLRGTNLAIPYPVWRYVSLGAAIGFSVFALVRRKSQAMSHFEILTDIIVSTVAVWIVSSEIIYWLSKSQSVDSYGIWLSVWYGLASLALFIIGFKLELKHLRICGFVLSGATVLKLFFYDMWNSELWVKAVVFVAVGVIFLIVSYIYSKYFKKEKLQDDGQNLGTE